jgi:hypothetical protein
MRLIQAGKAENRAFLQSSLLDGHNRGRNRIRSTKGIERVKHNTDPNKNRTSISTIFL